jgi:diphosphomevalonate decarboxylase
MPRNNSSPQKSQSPDAINPQNTLRSQTVFAPTNIALAKYWGKRDAKFNLPTNGSISATLDGLGSTTTVTFLPSLRADEFFVNNKPIHSEKGVRVLSLLRTLTSTTDFARVESSNNFPTGAGLASSASGLCALTFAAAEALKADMSLETLSQIARQGSGSACRSFYGGFVRWNRGTDASGIDSFATPVASEDHWPLDVWVAVVSSKEKELGSTQAMTRTAQSSPFFNAWVDHAEHCLPFFERAIARRDFLGLASLAEENCMRMHACAMGASPPILYWHAQTLRIMEITWQLRREGCLVFFTIDAGPNVVLFCPPEFSDRVLKALMTVPELESVMKSRIGPGPRHHPHHETKGDQLHG